MIGKEGKNITEENAMDHVQGYVLALDMTARKIQDELKKVRNLIYFQEDFTDN